jgi:hypothetical protein
MRWRSPENAFLKWGFVLYDQKLSLRFGIIAVDDR